MPEPPDVEGFRRVLAEHTGEPVRSVSVLDAGAAGDDHYRAPGAAGPDVHDDVLAGRSPVDGPAASACT
jgi:hypothetical protein